MKLFLHKLTVPVKSYFIGSGLKKKFAFIGLLLVSTSIIALTQPAHNGFETYDPSGGYYYKSVFVKDEMAYEQERGAAEPNTVNLFIFDPKTNRGSYLFGPGGSIYIIGLYFETGYDKSKKQMTFFNPAWNPYDYLRERKKIIPVMNNNNVDPREPLNRLLVVTVEDPKEKNHPSYSLWIADKSGQNLRKLMIYSETGKWHIDVKNKMIRIVDQKNGKVMINSIDL